jgi:hypothetical protein
MLVALIIAAEIGFWLVLASGLVARYLLGRRRLGAILLAGVPVVDLVLLVATAIDLSGGATAEAGHGLAAAYIGYSVAFGHTMVRWADERFAHRFAGGPPPSRPPRYGMAKARHEWRLFAKAVLAWVIGTGLLAAMILVVGDAERTAALEQWVLRLSLVTVIWSLWPITYTLWPAKAKPAAECA